MLWPQSLRARLTLWYTLVLGLPLVAFAGASFLVLDRALIHRSDAFLDETLGAFTTELASEQQEEPTTAARSLRRCTMSSSAMSGWQCSIRPVSSSWPGRWTRPPGTRVKHPVDLARVGTELRRNVGASRSVFSLGQGERAYRIAAEPVRIFGKPYLVAAAYPLHHDSETMEAVATAYVIAIPLLLLIAALGGYFLATRSLSPVAEMSARAAEISSSNLNERLPVG